MQRKAGKVPQVIEGDGVQVGTLRGQRGANRAWSGKYLSLWLPVPVISFILSQRVKFLSNQSW